jgi:hypothetical protein
MAAITAAAIGAGTAIYTTTQAKKQQKDAQNFAKDQMGAADPYAPYRADAAKRLDELMKDPSKISSTATYKARLQAAERTMASQGYTGSGNAAIAAADAGAAAYQQEFDNLAMLSGAGTGTQTAASVAGSAMNANSNANDNVLSGYAGVGNNLTNLAGLIWNRPGATTGGSIGPVVKQPITG